MSAQTTNHKCPACHAPLRFSGKEGRLVCDFCGSSYSPEEIEALYAGKEAEAAAAQARDEATGSKEQEMNVTAAGGDWGRDASMRAYTCPSCGAQVVCDANTAATSCPYCGSPTVVPGKLSGMLKPDYIIPFRLEKKDAVAALKKHYKGKFLLPGTFKEENHIKEIQGVYVPFWLFDGEAQGRAHYEAVNSTTYQDGDYRVTDTDHYDVIRDGSIRFERVPVDGSTKMPNDYMNSIEPYDYSEMVPFSSSYLPGFLAERYDVDAKEASEEADSRCTGTLERLLDESVIGYTSHSLLSRDVNIRHGPHKYALLPVWLLSTRWKGENYLFAMNGQTGKMVGNLPENKKLLNLCSWGVGLGLALLTAPFWAHALGRFIGMMLA